MSVQTGRMVSADEARDAFNSWRAAETRGITPTTVRSQMAPDLAHTVVVQAEQIATARALAEGWRASVEGFEECKSNLAVATALATQAACGDAILKALGVSGE